MSEQRTVAQVEVEVQQVEAKLAEIDAELKQYEGCGGQDVNVRVNRLRDERRKTYDQWRAAKLERAHAQKRAQHRAA